MNETNTGTIKNFYTEDQKDNIYSDLDARSRLIKGINKGADAIKVSYGSAGSNAIIEEELYPYHRATNDGKAILKDMKLSDRVENIGLNILKEVSDKSDKESGDGRKSSVLLTQAIINEGIKVKANPMSLKKSLDECLPIILKSIDEQTKEISPLDVGAIATIASESEKLGAIFQEIYTQIGKDGIIELDNSNLPETFYEITEGVKLLNCGFQWPYMANEDKGRSAIYRNPHILITKQKISSLVEIDNIFKALSKKGITEIVIFCDEIDLEVSKTLAQVHLSPQGSFKSLVIKAPTLWKDWIYEDFAKITGATIVNPAEGTTLKSFSMSWLGTCEKIITTKDQTVVLGTKDISDHIALLKEDLSDESKIRVARLQTKTAILKLGANSETELSYIRGKALDARNSSYLAMQYGVVAGGGICLAYASKKLPDTIGGKILSNSLRTLLVEIMFNAQFNKSSVPEKLGSDSKFGFDSRSGEFVDMFKAGILDSSFVVKTAIINALSVASTVLTVKVVVTKPK